MLCFDSSYEGANLEYVTSNDLKHYNLFMRPDTNTRTHFQWFCFRVRNRTIKNASFTIKNFAKGNMLYRQGLRPYFRSANEHTAHYRQLDT